jgi:primosomal protein N' (replication factor Y)
LQAIATLDRGRSAIVLVPEISLTPQTIERFKGRFADAHDAVAVLHSHLSEGERHDEWHKIHSGRARIAIGARSAVFAPLKNLGLIIVDEEHETTYKQEEAPRYHARDVAVVRAKIEKCAVLLGSATPSLESYYNTTIGKYELATLTQRIDEQQMPLMRIVDLRQERRKEKTLSILSEELSQAIADRLEKREQTILFLNRRGFSTSLLCSSCGEARDCPNCSVALTFHRHPSVAGRLSCHLCGHTAAVPKKCPACGKDTLIYAGFGTEKVEATVSHLFPKATVRRMDADSMTRKQAYRETLRNFRAGKIDILVGTQMIAKGLHFPNVTLVGIINADLALHLPDFRAGERTFQLLTQVAGRAGRGETAGEVFVQTYTPFSPSIQFARHHDFAGYFEQELEFRERCDFPPFKHAVLITVRSAHEGRAKFSAETLTRRLKEALGAEFMVSDATPAPLEKLQGQFRFHILLRGEAIMRLSRLVRETLDKLPFPEDVAVAVDVDPYQLL